MGPHDSKAHRLKRNGRRASSSQYMYILRSGYQTLRDTARWLPCLPPPKRAYGRDTQGDSREKEKGKRQSPPASDIWKRRKRQQQEITPSPCVLCCDVQPDRFPPTPHPPILKSPSPPPDSPSHSHSHSCPYSPSHSSPSPSPPSPSTPSTSPP